MDLLRFGDHEFPLRQYDVVCCPLGGTAIVHQMINNSSSDWWYLCVSAMEAPEVMEYPDADKFAVFVGSSSGGNKANMKVRSLFEFSNKLRRMNAILHRHPDDDQP